MIKNMCPTCGDEMELIKFKNDHFNESYPICFNYDGDCEQLEKVGDLDELLIEIFRLVEEEDLDNESIYRALEFTFKYRYNSDGPSILSAKVILNKILIGEYGPTLYSMISAILEHEGKEMTMPNVLDILMRDGVLVKDPPKQ